jgi:hypothetical protein
MMHLVAAKDGSLIGLTALPWTRAFVESIQAKLGSKAVGRKIPENSTNPGSVLRATPDAYNVHFEGEIEVLRQNNSQLLNVSSENAAD